MLSQRHRTGKPLRSHLPAMLVVLTLAVLAPNTGVGQSVIGGCQVFPANNVWNRPIDELPVDMHSAEYMAAVGSGVRVFVDPSIPINVVGPELAPQPLVKITYAEESDPGPVPIPDNPRLEPGGDAHM